MLRFSGARVHNLKNIDVEIPLGMMVAVTGVSGSGKSTLVHDVIFRSLEALHKARESDHDAEFDDAAEALDTAGRKLTCRKVEGAERITSTVMVDQSPIGRTPRSNPVTYIKAFDMIRGLFASTREAEKRGYTAGHFSFNIPGGRCETCQGDGTVTVEMQFLADVELICDECKGTRYKSGILEIQYNGRNIHEVLQLTVREAMEFFHAAPKLVQRLKVLDDVGLGYLRLGQSATTLSGGEAQRVKLAAHLSPSSVRGHAVHLRRADHRPALRRHREAARRLPAPDRERRQPDDHRAQSRRDQGRRLGDRSRARGRLARRARGGRDRHAGRRRARSRNRTPAAISRHVL